MGVMIAPVVGSGSTPACMALVANFIEYIDRKSISGNVKKPKLTFLKNHLQKEVVNLISEMFVLTKNILFWQIH